MPDETTTTAAKPPRKRLTDAQKIARMEQQLAQLKALQARRSRKIETREKIIIGGAIVKAMRDDPEWRARVVPLLQADVTRDIDKQVIAPWLSPISASQ